MKRILQSVAFSILLSCGVTSAQSAQDDATIMSTDDFKVTQRDFDYYVEVNVPEATRAAALARPGAVAEVLENIYVIKALAAKGAKNQVVDKDQLDWMKQHYADRLLMNRELANEVEEALSDVDWEAAAQEEYLATKKQYLVDEQIDASHILVSAVERSDEEALELARQLRQKIQRGADFNDVARESSDDDSAKLNGGNLGYFKRGQMVKPFEEAAFAMREPGEISEPVKTRFGYHLIRFNGHKAPRQQTFEEVKAPIIEKLQRERARQVRKSLIQQVKSGQTDQSVKVDKERLNSLERKYEATQSPSPSAGLK